MNLVNPYILGGGGGASALLTDLVAAWEMADTSDSSGNGYTWTNNGGVTFGSGIVGSTGTFVAATPTWLSIPAASATAFAFGDEDFTIELWTKQVTAATSQLLSKFDTAEAGWQLQYNSSVFAYQFTVNNNDYVIAFNSGYPTGADTWRHVLAWYDSTANTINIKIDDGTIDSLSITKTADGGADLRMGAREYGGFEDYANSLIGPARVWSRLLTSGEMTWLYNSGAGRSYPFTGSP